MQPMDEYPEHSSYIEKILNSWTHGPDFLRIHVRRAQSFVDAHYRQKRMEFALTVARRSNVDWVFDNVILFIQENQKKLSVGDEVNAVINGELKLGRIIDYSVHIDKYTVILHSNNTNVSVDSMFVQKIQDPTSITEIPSSSSSVSIHQPTPVSTQFIIDDLVFVQARTWPGIHKLGGEGRIIAVHDDGTYSVKYLIESGHERYLDKKYIKLSDLNKKLTSSEVSRPQRYRIGRCALVGCHAFVVDCGHVQPSLDLVIEVLRKRQATRVDLTVDAVVVRPVRSFTKSKRKQVPIRFITEPSSSSSMLECLGPASSAVPVRQQSRVMMMRKSLKSSSSVQYVDDELETDLYEEEEEKTSVVIVDDDGGDIVKSMKRVTRPIIINDDEEDEEEEDFLQPEGNASLQGHNYNIKSHLKSLSSEECRRTCIDRLNYAASALDRISGVASIIEEAYSIIRSMVKKAEKMSMNDASLLFRSTGVVTLVREMMTLFESFMLCVIIRHCQDFVVAALNLKRVRESSVRMLDNLDFETPRKSATAENDNLESLVEKIENRYIMKFSMVEAMSTGHDDWFVKVNLMKEFMKDGCNASMEYVDYAKKKKSFSSSMNDDDDGGGDHSSKEMRKKKEASFMFDNDSQSRSNRRVQNDDNEARERRMTVKGSFGGSGTFADADGGGKRGVGGKSGSSRSRKRKLNKNDDDDDGGGVNRNGTTISSSSSRRARVVKTTETRTVAGNLLKVDLCDRLSIVLRSSLSNEMLLSSWLTYFGSITSASLSLEHALGNIRGQLDALTCALQTVSKSYPNMSTMDPSTLDSVRIDFGNAIITERRSKGLSDGRDVITLCNRKHWGLWNGCVAFSSPVIVPSLFRLFLDQQTTMPIDNDRYYCDVPTCNFDIFQPLNDCVMDELWSQYCGLSKTIVAPTRANELLSNVVKLVLAEIYSCIQPWVVVLEEEGKLPLAKLCFKLKFADGKSVETLIKRLYIAQHMVLSIMSCLLKEISSLEPMQARTICVRCFRCLRELSSFSCMLFSPLPGNSFGDCDKVSRFHTALNEFLGDDDASSLDSVFDSAFSFFGLSFRIPISSKGLPSISESSIALDNVVREQLVEDIEFDRLHPSSLIHMFSSTLRLFLNTVYRCFNKADYCSVLSDCSEILRCNLNCVKAIVCNGVGSSSICRTSLIKSCASDDFVAFNATMHVTLANGILWSIPVTQEFIQLTSTHVFHLEVDVSCFTSTDIKSSAGDSQCVANIIESCKNLALNVKSMDEILPPSEILICRSVSFSLVSILALSTFCRSRAHVHSSGGTLSLSCCRFEAELRKGMTSVQSLVLCLQGTSPQDVERQAKCLNFSVFADMIVLLCYSWLALPHTIGSLELPEGDGHFISFPWSQSCAEVDINIFIGKLLDVLTSNLNAIADCSALIVSTKLRMQGYCTETLGRLQAISGQTRSATELIDTFSRGFNSDSPSSWFDVGNSAAQNSVNDAAIGQRLVVVGCCMASLMAYFRLSLWDNWMFSADKEKEKKMHADSCKLLDCIEKLFSEFVLYSGSDDQFPLRFLQKWSLEWATMTLKLGCEFHTDCDDAESAEALWKAENKSVIAESLGKTTKSLWTHLLPVWRTFVLSLSGGVDSSDNDSEIGDRSKNDLCSNSIIAVDSSGLQNSASVDLISGLIGYHGKKFTKCAENLLYFLCTVVLMTQEVKESMHVVNDGPFNPWYRYLSDIVSLFARGSLESDCRIMNEVECSVWSKLTKINPSMCRYHVGNLVRIFLLESIDIGKDISSDTSLSTQTLVLMASITEFSVSRSFSDVSSDFLRHTVELAGDCLQLENRPNDAGLEHCQYVLQRFVGGMLERRSSLVQMRQKAAVEKIDQLMSPIVKNCAISLIHQLFAQSFELSAGQISRKVSSCCFSLFLIAEYCCQSSESMTIDIVSHLLSLATTESVVKSRRRFMGKKIVDSRALNAIKSYVLDHLSSIFWMCSCTHFTTNDVSNSILNSLFYFQDDKRSSNPVVDMMIGESSSSSSSRTVASLCSSTTICIRQSREQIFSATLYLRLILADSFASNQKFCDVYKLIEIGISQSNNQSCMTNLGVGSITGVSLSRYLYLAVGNLVCFIGNDGLLPDSLLRVTLGPSDNKQNIIEILEKLPVCRGSEPGITSDLFVAMIIGFWSLLSACLYIQAEKTSLSATIAMEIVNNNPLDRLFIIGNPNEIARLFGQFGDQLIRGCNMQVPNQSLVQAMTKCFSKYKPISDRDVCMLLTQSVKNQPFIRLVLGCVKINNILKAFKPHNIPTNIESDYTSVTEMLGSFVELAKQHMNYQKR